MEKDMMKITKSRLWGLGKSRWLPPPKMELAFEVSASGAHTYFRNSLEDECSS